MASGPRNSGTGKKPGSDQVLQSLVAKTQHNLQEAPYQEEDVLAETRNVLDMRGDTNYAKTR